MKTPILNGTVGQVALAMAIILGTFSSAQAFVAPTESVGNAAIDLPFDTARKPVIEMDGVPVNAGQTYVGDTLFADVTYFGGWVPTPTTMTYQWFANTKKIKRASSASYTLTSGQIGKTISVRAVGSRESYVTTTSDPSDAINAVLAGRTFASAADPIVNGVAVVGQLLNSQLDSTWSAPGQIVAYSYQWLRNGKAIRGATEFNYFVTSKDLRKRITVRWKGTAPGYITVVRTSIPTEKVTR